MLLKELLTLDKPKMINWGNQFIKSVFDNVNKSKLDLPQLQLKNDVKLLRKEGSDGWSMKFKTTNKNIEIEFNLDFSGNKLTYVTCEFNDKKEDKDGWHGHTEIIVDFDIDKVSPDKAAKKYFNIDDRQSLSSMLKQYY